MSQRMLMPWRNCSPLVGMSERSGAQTKGCPCSMDVPFFTGGGAPIKVCGFDKLEHHEDATVLIASFIQVGLELDGVIREVEVKEAKLRLRMLDPNIGRHGQVLCTPS